jgi:integral membrane protein
MLPFFRILSLIEGLSLIVLLLIAMPAKYHFAYVDSIWLVGMTHGVLWLVYFVVSFAVSHQQKWSVIFWLMALFTSITPFGCFILDRKLKASNWGEPTPNLKYNSQLWE